MAFFRFTRSKHRKLINFTAAHLMAVLFALLAGTSSAWAAELNVYTSRHYKVDEKVNKLFEEKTGVTVNKLFVKNATQLMERLKLEGKSSPADVLILTDVGNLVRAQESQLFQPLKSKIVTETVPQRFRDSQDLWTALSVRARILVYHKDRVKPSELSSYESLVDPKWKGRLLVRSSTNIYNQSLVASLIKASTVEDALTWSRGIVANMARKPEGGDTDQIRAVSRGVGDVAIVNSYYYARLAASNKAKDKAVVKTVKPFFPNQAGRGTHVNISGAGIVKGAKNTDQARQYIEFLLTQEVQSLYSLENFEYAVHPQVKASPQVQSFGDPKLDQTPLSKFATHSSLAVKTLEKSGWR